MAGKSAGILAGEAYVRFAADNDELIRAMQLTEGQMKAWGQRIQKLGRAMAVAGAGGAALFIKPIREAANVEQLLGRFTSVFESFGSDAAKFADDLASKINQSGLTLRDQLAQFNAYLKGIGFDPAESAKISKQLTAWTNDWIAFDDTIVNGQEAVDLFLSALSGEVRPARRMGADLRVLSLDAEAAAQGLGKAADELSEVQRVQLRLGIIGRALGRSGVTGQAAREVDTLAARFRGIKAAFRDFSVTVGNVVLPAFSDIVGKAIDITKKLDAFVKQNPKVVEAFAKLSLAAIGTGVAMEILGRSMVAASIATTLRSIVTSIGYIVANPIGAALLGGTVALGAVYANFLRLENSVTSLRKAFERLLSVAKDVFRLMKTELLSGDVLGIFATGIGGVRQAIAELGSRIKGLEVPAAGLLMTFDQVNTALGLMAGYLKSIQGPLDAVTKIAFGTTVGEGVQDLLKLQAVLEELKRREKAAELAGPKELNPQGGGRRAGRVGGIEAGQDAVGEALQGTGLYESENWRDVQIDIVARMRKIEAIFAQRREDQNRFLDYVSTAFEDAFLGDYQWRRRQLKLAAAAIQKLPRSIDGFLYDKLKPWFAWIEQNQLEFVGRPARAPQLATPSVARVSFGAARQTYGALQIGDSIDIAEEQLEEQKKIRKAIERANEWQRRNAGLPTNGE